MPGIGVLIVDADASSQRALKGVLDSEGWRVRLVPSASKALEEIATGEWNLVIANSALADVNAPLYSVLRDLALAEAMPLNGTEAQSKRIRVLFLVPVLLAKDVQPVLEREGLPYALKPYPLNDLLEKVSELLVDSGVMAQPIRAIGGFTELRKRRRQSPFKQQSRNNSMFASREDYQMTEEEIAEFEKQEKEEQDRKRRDRELKQ